MDALRAKGRGRHYSPVRGAVEQVLRVVYGDGWAAALWGRAPGATEVRVVRECVVVPGLGRPLRLGFVSDLHIGPTTPPRLLEAAFDLLAEARPDVLALGGDYVFMEATARTAETLRGLVARVPAATKVAVMGNHDLWTHHGLLEDALREAGATVLINQGLKLPGPHGHVGVVGLDEPWTGAPDAPAAFAAVADARVRLALVHAPEGLPLLAGRGVALALCGHTHGGHIALPGPRPVVVPGHISRQYPYGRHELDGLTLLVSRGLGGIELPIRAYAPPDVIICDLVP